MTSSTDAMDPEHQGPTWLMDDRSKDDRILSVVEVLWQDGTHALCRVEGGEDNDEDQPLLLCLASGHVMNSDWFSWIATQDPADYQRQVERLERRRDEAREEMARADALIASGAEGGPGRAWLQDAVVELDALVAKHRPLLDAIQAGHPPAP